jgi:hypothetical protein
MLRLAFTSLLLLSSLFFSTACGSDSTPASGVAGSGGAGGSAGAGGGGAGTSGAGTSGAGDAAVHGSVVVTLHPPIDGDGYTTAIGRFFAGPQPEILSLEASSTDGDCTLFIPRAPFCSEPCAPAVCTADDVCTDYPEPRHVGTLTLSGLGEPLSLEPTSTKIVYQSPSLAYPPCEAGAPVTASASGVSVQAECIAPLELTGPDPIPVTAGAPVQLSWLPAAAGAQSRVLIKLDVSHHGGSKGEIDCEVADTGSYEISAALVSELLGLGLAGFPTINLDRISVGADASNPHVELVLSSDVTRAVDTGVTSCLDQMDCPDGQSCIDGGICE